MDFPHVDGYLDRLRCLVSRPALLRSLSLSRPVLTQNVARACVRVKWVGLFVTALVGIYTIEDLWNKFGDLRMGFVRRFYPSCPSEPLLTDVAPDVAQRTYVRHWVARILCLIVIPACVYALTFKLHFLILNHSGPGDSQMSSLFQAHLRGNDFAQNPLGEDSSIISL